MRGECATKKRKLKDLNLLDDFLFNTMVNYPEIGEKFSRELLRTIFQKEFGPLTVVPQKIYTGSDTDRHGARLDVYLEEDAVECSGIYDIEPEQKHGTVVRQVLPKRVRFYHAKIDAGSLKAGQSYKYLKNVVIIIITPYDPFDLDRMVYTICNMCKEEPSMPYDDGAKTIFLNTHGTKGEINENLRQLLHYMEYTIAENAVNGNLKNIQQMVDHVKQDEEVSLEYMKIFEREEMLIEQGREEEQANTERERKRAEEAERRLEIQREQAEAQQEKLKEQLKKLQEELEQIKKATKKVQ